MWMYACMLVWTWLAVPACGAGASGELELLVLHNNDMHARFEETSARSGRCGGPADACYGGFARVAHLVREARANASQPHVLYLNAGDTYTGTAWFTRFRHDIVTEFLNILKPDAASLGNHEFDDGISGLVPYLERKNFPVVTANIDDPRLKGLQKSVILTVGGHPICVIGYLTPQTAEISLAEDVHFGDEIEAINRESEACAARGAKTFIALGHSGFEMDKRIAKLCPRVDAVVGGHTNTFLWTGPQPDLEAPEGEYPTVVRQKGGKRVPVVQAYAYTKYMGRLYLTIERASGRVVSFRGAPQLVTAAVPQDADVLEVLERYRPEVAALDRKVMGRSKVFLEGRDVVCRRRECNLGNLFTDAFVDFRAAHYAGHYWTDAAIAMMNSGGIRSAIDTAKRLGDISHADLYGTLPFNNDLVTVVLSGRELLAALEFSVHGDGDTSGGEFLQFSGLRAVYDRRRESGRRLVSAAARCASCAVPAYEPVDPDRDYKVIVTTFLAGGGDGYKIIKQARNKTVLSINDYDSVVSYIQKLQVIYPAEEGRIVMLGSAAVTSSRCHIFIILIAFILVKLIR